MKKYIKSIIVLLLICAFSFLNILDVNAGGGADEGTSPTGGSCQAGKAGWDTCFGYSWQKYKVIKDLPNSNTVSFHTTTATGARVYLHYCKTGQYIYNYGFEVHDASGNSKGTQVSTQSNKNGTQARWRSSGALGAYNGSFNTTSSYLQVVGYSDATTVKKNYDAMLAYDNENGTSYAHGTNWNNVGYFCFDPDVVEKYTVNVHAKYLAEDGTVKDLNSGTPIQTITNVGKGNSVQVSTSGKEFEGYSWNQWGGGSCDNFVAGTSCSSRSAYTKGITKNWIEEWKNGTQTNWGFNGYYLKNKFSGRAIVNEQDNTSNIATSYKNETKTIEIDYDDAKSNCSEGKCKAEFRFYLKQDNGNYGETHYQIYKNGSLFKSNGSGLEYTQDPNYDTSGVVASGLGSEYSYMKGIYSNIAIGSTSCFSIKYIDTPADDGLNWNKAEEVKICAKVNAPPSVEVTEADSDIGISVRDTSSASQYRNWTTSVYAKPGDKVELKGSFEPKYVDLRNSNVKNVVVEYDNNLTKTSSSETAFSVKTHFTNLFGLGSWKNAFAIVSDGNCLKTKSNSIGSSSKYEATIDYTVDYSHVGTSKSAQAVTNICSWTKYTPWSVRIEEGGSVSDAYIDNNSHSSGSAFINVPYNFSNSVSMVDSGSDEIEVGVAKTIKYNIRVGKKTNNETNGVYATSVPGAQHWLQFEYYQGGNLVDTDSNPKKTKNFILSSLDDIKNGKTFSEEASFNPSGTSPNGSSYNKVCVKAFMWPKNSGSDINMDTSGFKDTAESDDSGLCFTISKKPTFQVWGSSIYTTDDWETKIATKNSRTFGSWVELGLISEGTVKGFSSGASTGYAFTSDASSVNRYINKPNNVAISGLGGSGSDESSYCDRSLLSFANSECNSDNSVGGIIGVSDALKNDKEILLSKLNSTGDDRLLSSGSDSFEGKIFIKKDGSATISEDIQYKDGPYNSVNDIPKVIIYATGNITIGCGVHRVDAILIADGDVITCESDNYDSSDNSSQLKINGAIIAKNIKLNRTYGAASGNNSIIPAEIINYDSSLYLWAYANSEGTSGVTQMKEVYSKDLPPRY